MQKLKTFTIDERGSTHPLRTPSTRLSMKNEPRIMSETKYAHVKFVPTASFV